MSGLTYNVMDEHIGLSSNKLTHRMSANTLPSVTIYAEQPPSPYSVSHVVSSFADIKTVHTLNKHTLNSTDCHYFVHL